VFDQPVVLDLPAKQIAQLALSLLVSTITLASVRAIALQGTVLVLFATWRAKRKRFGRVIALTKKWA